MNVKDYISGIKEDVNKNTQNINNVTSELLEFYKNSNKKSVKNNLTESTKEQKSTEIVSENNDHLNTIESTTEPVSENQDPLNKFLIFLNKKIENSIKIKEEKNTLIDIKEIPQETLEEEIQNDLIVETSSDHDKKIDEKFKDEAVFLINALKNSDISERKNKKLPSKIYKILDDKSSLKQLESSTPSISSTDNIYLKELKTNFNSDKSSKEFINVSDDVKKYVLSQMKKFSLKDNENLVKKHLAGAGGGGSDARQYANGGTMNGDLNVMGKYLSGGKDLAELFSVTTNISGFTNKLVADTHEMVLNPDGTIEFPNNTIQLPDKRLLHLEASDSALETYSKIVLSPYGFFAYDQNSNSISFDSSDNEIILTTLNTYEWKFNQEGVLIGPKTDGILDVAGLNSHGSILSAGKNLADIFLTSETNFIVNSSRYEDLLTNVKTKSANWDSSYLDTLVLNQQVADIQLDISALDGILTGNAIVTNSNNTLLNTNSANWDSVYTTVNSNSADWNYQGSDIKALTGYWDTAYNTVTNNSLNWDSSFSKVNNLTIDDVSNLYATLTGKQPLGNYPVLDNNNTIPSIYLPSYVDDIVEYSNYASLPLSGEASKIYVTTDNFKNYRWSGTSYTEIVSSPGTTDSLLEGSVNKYFTNARAASAAPVQSVAGRTGNVILGISDINNLNTQLTATNVTTSTFQVKAVSQGIYNDGTTIPVGTSLETIIRNMLITLVPPTYNVPLLSVAYGSPSISTTYEVGFTIPTFTITPTYTQRDGGSLVDYAYYRNSSFLANGLTYSMPSFQINSTTTLQVSARYNDGPIYNDNLGNPYPSTSIKAGSLINTIIINTLYPYFYGKSSTQPTEATIASSIQAGTATKVLADANGTVSITYNANGEYIWFAHLGTQTTKTKWYFTELNSGNIGSGNFINSPLTQNVTSPQGYWTNTQYKIYISSGQTSTTGVLQYRNA